MDELVTGPVIARIYSVSADAVAGWARDGKIPTATTTPGGHRRYRIADVLAAFPIEGVTAQSAAAAIAERAERTEGVAS